MNNIKTKFHLNKRAPSRFASGGTVPSASTAVALVDERYLGWLAAQQTPATASPAPVLQRSALMSVFAHLARCCQPDAALLRTCLFTDRPVTELVDDVLLRPVPPHAQDGGLGLVRSLGLELTQLAQRGQCPLVLVASDDERLIPYIDEAQWRGLKVVLLTDEASHDVARLMTEDPSWARLLMQADRRVSINSSAWQALTTPGLGYFASRTAEAPRDADVESLSRDVYPDPQVEPDTDWRAQVERVLQDWWNEETVDARLDLFEEMQNSQGVPPETDRHLLLRVRRELARPLSFPEKKVMREMIRAMVLAQPPAVDEPADA